MLDTLNEKILSVVRDQLLSAERAASQATEHAKIATGAAVSASQTLQAALQSVESANIHAQCARDAAARAEINLAQAKAEFAALLERVK